MIKRRILFVILWLLSLAAISFYGGAISYGFFFGMSIIPVICGIYLLYVYWKFLIYQEVIVKHVVCGQAIPYFFVLQNDDFVTFSSVSLRLYSDFSYVEKVPDNIAYELLPGDKFRYDTKLTCKYRGEYLIGINEIILTDFFQLFRMKYKMPSPVKAFVFPKIVKLEELKSIPEITAFMQRNTMLQDMEPDAIVRDYIPGDSLKRIHWKATAREQTLKVRNMTGEEKQGIAILCDTKRCCTDITEYLPAENKILETLLALSFFFAKEGTKLSLLYRHNNIRSQTISDFRGFEAFYREAARISFDSSQTFLPLLEQAIDSHLCLKCKAVFLILQELTDDIFAKVLSLTAGGLIAVLYVITEKDISSYTRLNSVRTKIIPISPETELEDVL